MANTETTTKLKVDISDLVKGMQTAKRQIALANAEFKNATAGMDDWSKSADGVSAKLTQLDKTLVNQKEILGNLEEQLDKTVQLYGKGSKEADNLRIKIENQKASITKTEKEISKYDDRLEEVNEAQKKAKKSGKSVADVLDEMAEESKDAEKSVKELGDGFTVMKGAMAELVADGIKSLVSGFINLAGETREYRTQLAQLETAFESAELTTENAKKTYEDLYSVLGDEGKTTEATQQLAKISKSQEDLDANTRILTGVFAEFGDSIPTEGLAEGMASTVAMGEVQGVLADALEWQGVNLEEFNEKLGKLSSEEERAQLIQSTLTDLYGESADAYRENNKEIIASNKAQAELTDAYADLGAKAEPIITELKTGFAELLGKILEFVDGADITPVTDAIADGFDYIIENVLPPIKDAIQWIIDNKDLVIAGIGGIAGALVTLNVANMIFGLVKAFQAFKLAQEGATVATWLLNVAMSANPIGIVIALIVGLVTAFVVLWNKSEAFRNFWINLWKSIVKFVSDSAKAIGEFFVNLWSDIQKVWSVVSEWFNTKIIKPIVTFFSEMWDKLKKGGSDAWEGIKSVFSKVGSFFSETFSKAWQKVKDIFSTGGKIFDGIKDGIVSAFKSIVNRLIRGINKVVSIPFNAINSALKTIKNIEILEVKPFSGLISEISIPKIPELAGGIGLAKKGKQYLLEGNGDEMVLPLAKDSKWLDQVAGRIVEKGGTVGGKAQTVTNNYNHTYNQTNNSPKALSRLEIYRQSKNLFSMAGGVS